MSSEISEVVAGQVNERFLEVPTNSTYFADLATLNAAQSGAQNPFDAVVREVVDLRAAAGNMSAFDSRYAPLPGAWTSYTPTVTPGSGSITTLGAVSARYVVLGKLMHLKFSVKITTLGTAGSALYIDFPPGFTGVGFGTGSTAVGSYTETFNTGVTGVVWTSGGSPQAVLLYKNDNTTAFTANGDLFQGSCTLELQ